MMQFVFTYEDIKLWMHNFLDLDLQVEAFNADCGELKVTSPDEGIRKLLPRGYREYKQYFSIDAFDATSITVNILCLSRGDELFNTLLSQYINYCLQEDIMEQMPRGRIKIHLDQISLIRDIELRSLVFSEKGLEVSFSENLNLYQHLRMLQQLLRADYTRVHVIPEDMPYSGYWFSDDTLDYTLIMANHPADIRLCASVHVMEWLEVEKSLSKESFHPLYPTTQIDFQYGDVKVTIPLTIAEKEINETTLERNCKRVQEEVTSVMATILDNVKIKFGYETR